MAWTISLASKTWQNQDDLFGKIYAVIVSGVVSIISVFQKAFAQVKRDDTSQNCLPKNIFEVKFIYGLRRVKIGF